MNEFEEKKYCEIKDLEYEKRIKKGFNKQLLKNIKNNQNSN